MILITLKCCACGERKVHAVEAEPRFAFELVQYASDADWVGVLDRKWQRGLVFCSDTCVEANVTKAGNLRRHIRPPGDKL